MEKNGKANKQISQEYKLNSQIGYIFFKAVMYDVMELFHDRMVWLGIGLNGIYAKE